MTKLEDLKEYDFPFSRFDAIEKRQKEEAEEEKKPKIEEVKEEDEEETKDDKPKDHKGQADDMLKKLTTPGKSISLDVEEVDADEMKKREQQDEDDEEDAGRKLLQGFKLANVQIHLLAEPELAKLTTKKKY
jgi:hypothetical protein